MSLDQASKLQKYKIYIKYLELVFRRTGGAWVPMDKMGRLVYGKLIKIYKIIYKLCLNRFGLPLKFGKITKLL